MIQLMAGFADWTSQAWDIKKSFDVGNVTIAFRVIVTLLVEHRGNQSAASKAIGVHDRTFRKWIERASASGLDVRKEIAKRGAPTSHTRPEYRAGAEKKAPKPRKSKK